LHLVGDLFEKSRLLITNTFLTLFFDAWIVVLVLWEVKVFDELKCTLLYNR